METFLTPKFYPCSASVRSAPPTTSRSTSRSSTRTRSRFQISFFRHTKVFSLSSSNNSSTWSRTRRDRRLNYWFHAIYLSNRNWWSFKPEVVKVWRVSGDFGLLFYVLTRSWRCPMKTIFLCSCFRANNLFRCQVWNKESFEKFSSSVKPDEATFKVPKVLFVGKIEHAIVFMICNIFMNYT